MQEKEILAGNLALWLSFGRGGVVVTFKDFGGCLLARLPGRATLAGPTASDREWQGICEALLPLAYSHYVECTVLREVEFGERLDRVEEERHTSDRIAEDLYRFFSHMARRTIPEGCGSWYCPVKRS